MSPHITPHPFTDFSPQIFPSPYTVPCGIKAVISAVEGGNIITGVCVANSLAGLSARHSTKPQKGMYRLQCHRLNETIINHMATNMQLGYLATGFTAMMLCRDGVETLDDFKV